MVSSAHTDLFDHADPWTEEDFLALPVDRRVELLGGSLLVSPASSHLHQWLSFQLCLALNAAAPGGVRALEAVNVRVGPEKILIPNVAVIVSPDMTAAVSPAAAVRLVVEITSPSNAFIDRGVKPQLYAHAGIPHYLRVELQRVEPTAQVFALAGEQYVETARFGPGEATRLVEPFPVSFDLAALAANP